jgi:HrpA-like RNA helicase
MPMDVRLGKLVLYGIFFKCLDPILVVCAAISFGKSPFETKPTNEFATLSDFESLVLIWRNFEKLEKNEKYKFCKKWFLDVGIMIGIGENRVQIMQALEQTRLFKGLKADGLKFGSHNLYGDVKDIVSAAFGCGLYPNIIFLPGNEPIYMLRHPDTKVIVHQGSVLSNQIAKIKTPTYFTYYSIQLKKSISGKTQATVHDLSKIHLLPLILLGCLTLVYKPVQGVLVMDDIVVNCDPKQGALACMLRERLKYLLLGLCRGETPEIDDLIKILEN